MNPSIDYLQAKIDSLHQFIKKYEQIGDSHMVDYFTKDHWNKLLSYSTRKQLKSIGVSGLFEYPSYVGDDSLLRLSPCLNAGEFVIEDLNEFAKTASNCHLSVLNVLTSVEQIVANLQKDVNKSYNEGIPEITSKEYMCAKKSHEVEVMSPVVNGLCLYANTTNVLDVGSGKGYLSTHLSLRYNLHVTAVDCDEKNTLGAHARASNCLKYWRKHLSGKISTVSAEKLMNENDLGFSPVTAFVDCRTDLMDIGSEANNSNSGPSQYVVTGLHTCGNLGSDLLNLFANNTNVIATCVVGCCYHHMTESLDTEAGFPMSCYIKSCSIPLGRNKRMLALKAPERFANTDSEERAKSDRSLFYRAVLSVILEEKFNISSDRRDVQIGKIFSKCSGFNDYIRKSLKKLKLNDELLSDQEIDEYSKRYESDFDHLVMFSHLRQMYAPAVEAVILIDKLLFLLESKSKAGIEHAYLTQLFDPVLSPRCYALVACKKKQ